MIHSGLDNNITFKDFENDLKPYIDKVDIVNFTNICDRNKYKIKNVVLYNEVSQRDYAKDYIESKYNPTEKDLFIIVDLDETSTREEMEFIIKNPPKDYYFPKGSMHFPYYYHKVEVLDKGLVIRYNKSMYSLTKLRIMKRTDNNTLKFKYCFKDIKEYRNKLVSLNNQEFNRYPFTTNN